MAAIAYVSVRLAPMACDPGFIHAARMHQGALSTLPTYAALPRAREPIAGQSVLVTVATAAQRRWFAHAFAAIAVARELGSPALWRDNHVHAWVLMPDHLHLALTLGQRESIWQLMARIKAVSARAAQAVVGTDRPFWADAFHDRALRGHGEIVRAARHIITNPVRAGLVDTLWGWPFWDSQWLPEPGSDPCDIPRPSAAALARLPARA